MPGMLAYPEKFCVFLTERYFNKNDFSYFFFLVYISMNIIILYFASGFELRNDRNRIFWISIKKRRIWHSIELFMQLIMERLCYMDCGRCVGNAFSITVEWCWKVNNYSQTFIILAFNSFFLFRYFIQNWNCSIYRYRNRNIIKFMSLHCDFKINGCQ